MCLFLCLFVSGLLLGTVLAWVVVNWAARTNQLVTRQKIPAVGAKTAAASYGAADGTRARAQSINGNNATWWAFNGVYEAENRYEPCLTRIWFLRVLWHCKVAALLTGDEGGVMD